MFKLRVRDLTCVRMKKEKRVRFGNRILMLGHGAVAQCTLPVLAKHIKVPLKNITVVDFQDRSGALAKWIDKGVNFLCEEANRDNLPRLLGKYLSEGDLLVDLAWNIDCCELLQWCHDNGALYINTSIEVWDPYSSHIKNLAEKTLYWRHMNVRNLVSHWEETGPTAVLEHGANPGLISHFVKQGLIDIGESLIAEKRVKGRRAEKIRQLIDEQEFNYLAKSLGVKVIHCSERDTQITNKPKQVDEFVNTWSIEGFREEGTATTEMGWGTHEKELPPTAFGHPEGPRNQIYLARMGMDTWVVSWVPNYSIQGMVIRHGEAFTISDYLTVWRGRRAVYRPTVHYAYCPCDSAIASLNELCGYDYHLQEKQRILSDDIISGSDILGALLMGHPYTSWWIGSNLSIEESRRLVPHQNATTMQVAGSVVAAVMWMLENPSVGVCTPEDLPHEYILSKAKPYLGNFISTPSDWTPLKHSTNPFLGFNNPDIDHKDPWQFKNFLVAYGKELSQQKSDDTFEEETHL
jgi:homospermidine synthase